MKISDEPPYGGSLALLTDLYQLTMVYGYWKAKIADRQAVFHLNFRRYPFHGGYAIAAGLESAVHFLQKFRFSSSDLDYLGGLLDAKGKPLFEKGFLQFLADFSFQCDVDAMPEGTLVFPNEPLIRVKGPIWQAQLLESPLLNLINFQTLIATKASRICFAARPDPVIEFGMRRAQGIDGAISASRAAFIGGCESTSHVLAGKLFSIPVRGTHAHSWVMAFEEEKKAFETFAQIMPNGCVLLVDTYDSIQGVKRAIKVAKSLKKKGFSLAGVRLDSGDLANLSIEIRNLLDEEGLSQVQIMASNELDEYVIRDLKQQGAKISIWGVGTNLVTAKDQPALDGIYKLSAIQDKKGNWVDKLKLSDHVSKTTNPGILQVRRYFDGKSYLGDAIFDERLGVDAPRIFDGDEVRSLHGSSHSDLLVPIIRKGVCKYEFPSLNAIRDKAKEELSRLPVTVERFLNPELYPSGLEEKLYRKKIVLIDQLKKSS